MSTELPESEDADPDISQAGEDDGGTDGPQSIPIQLIERHEVDDLVAELDPAAANWLTVNGFKGKLGQVLYLPGQDGGIDKVLFGWGDRDARARDRFHLGDFAQRAAKGTYRLDSDLDVDEAEEAALGWLLGRYRFEKYKKGAPEEAADLLAPDGVDPTRLIRMVEGVFLTRDLINTPACDMGPSALEATARKLAARHNATIEVTEGEDLLEQNFP